MEGCDGRCVLIIHDKKSRREEEKNTTKANIVLSWSICPHVMGSIGRSSSSHDIHYHSRVMLCEGTCVTSWRTRVPPSSCSFTSRSASCICSAVESMIDSRNDNCLTNSAQRLSDSGARESSLFGRNRILRESTVHALAGHHGLAWHGTTHSVRIYLGVERFYSLHKSPV